MGIGEAVGEPAGLVCIGEGSSGLCLLAFWALAQSPSTSLDQLLISSDSLHLVPVMLFGLSTRLPVSLVIEPMAGLLPSRWAWIMWQFS